MYLWESNWGVDKTIKEIQSFLLELVEIQWKKIKMREFF